MPAMLLGQNLSTWPLVAVLIGSLGVFLLLPTPRERPRVLGLLLVLGVLAAFSARVFMETRFSVEMVLQQLFGSIAILGAVFLVTQANPARAALAFTLVVLGTSGLYLILGAPFLAAANVIVYAGAIIVTFLFVLMLARQDGPSDASSRSRDPFLATLTGGILLAVLTHTLLVDSSNASPGISQTNSTPVMPGRELQEQGLRLDTTGRPAIPAENTAFLGAEIFSKFLMAVEIAGVLLVVATVAAIVIAQRGSPLIPQPGSNRIEVSP